MTRPGCTCGGTGRKTFRATVKVGGGGVVERELSYEAECPCVSGADPSRDVRPVKWEPAS